MCARLIPVVKMGLKHAEYGRREMLHRSLGEIVGGHSAGVTRRWSLLSRYIMQAEMVLVACVHIKPLLASQR